MVWQIISEGFNAIIESYKDYQGSGLIFIVFYLSMLYVGFSTKNNKVIKDAFVRYPIYVLLVFFCPIWYIYVYLFSDYEILYRILWLLPLGLIICYALTEVIYRLNEKMRVFAFVAAIVILIISGEYTYRNQYFSLAENPYHVPDTVVEICDEISVEGREIRAAFPREMIMYVRQYTSCVVLPYGREIFMDFGSWENELQSLLEKDTIDTERMAFLLRDSETPYLVISSEKNFTENPAQYEFVFVTNVDGYDIYLDNNAYLGTDFINYR